MTNTEIINKYTRNELTLDEANAKLNGIKLNPDKNVLSEEEKRTTTVGIYPDMANGWGLLDSGTGTFDKVRVENGKLMNGGMGCAEALCFIGGKTYKVADETLVEG